MEFIQTVKVDVLDSDKYRTTINEIKKLELNLSVSGRTLVPVGVQNQAVPIDGIVMGNVLIFQSESALKIKINPIGLNSTWQTIHPGCTSVIHVEYDSVFVRNDTGSIGYLFYFCAGD